jgi:hypothetical protein
MADLLDEEATKLASMNGSDLTLDSYLVIHLSQCIMTLLTTFEGGPRLFKLVKVLIKVI